MEIAILAATQIGITRCGTQRRDFSSRLVTILDWNSLNPSKLMIREAKFEAIWRLHADEIYRYTRSMLGNRADAEDATQETLLRLWRALSDVQLSKSRAWLYRTARNVCIDHLRKQSTRQTEAFSDDLPWEGAAKPTADSNLDRESFRERIDQCMESLSETQRSVFILYEINRLRYREIAETLDLPMNTVKVYLSRARENIRKQLMKEGIWTTPCNR